MSTLAAAIEHLKATAEVVRIPHYKAFWTEAKQVLELFRARKPLLPHERQKLWERYREVCDTVHVRQAEERHHLREGSKERRAALEAEIGKAGELLEIEDKTLAVASTRTMLQQILEKLKKQSQHDFSGNPEVGPEGPGPSRMLREDREAVWHRWQAVRSALAERQMQIGQQLTDRAIELNAMAAQSEPISVLKMIRALQEDVFQVGMKRDNREAIRSILNQAWKTSILRMQQMREERRAKHAEWKARMVENLKTWSEQIARREQTAAHLREQITKLEGMLENARSDDHAERVRTWIGETEMKLQNTEGILKILHEKSLAVKAKLSRQE